MVATSPDKAIAARVTQALTHARIPRSQLAQAWGISYVSTWRKLAGHTRIRVDELRTITNLTGVPVAELIDGEQAAS